MLWVHGRFAWRVKLPASLRLACYEKRARAIPLGPGCLEGPGLQIRSKSGPRFETSSRAALKRRRPCRRFPVQGLRRFHSFQGGSAFGEATRSEFPPDSSSERQALDSLIVGLWPSIPAAIELLRQVFRVSKRAALARRRIVQPADRQLGSMPLEFIDSAWTCNMGFRPPRFHMTIWP